MFQTFSLIILLLVSIPMFAQQKSPKIVVIGAGLSGLTCAYRLQEKGFDVSVYEAHNRVGGRVFTVSVDGYLAELGGQNIFDGGEAENMLSLIEELGLETEGRKTVLQLNYFDN